MLGSRFYLMRKLSWMCLAMCGLLLVGCRDKPKEVSKMARAEASTLASEAEFAFQVRDYARSEAALVRATELDPDIPFYWMDLGAARLKQGNRDGARKAYEHALKIHQKAYKRDKTNPTPLLRQMETLIYLGRHDKARDLWTKTLKDFPEHPEVKHFDKTRAVETLINDPGVRDLVP